MIRELVIVKNYLKIILKFAWKLSKSFCKFYLIFHFFLSTNHECLSLCNLCPNSIIHQIYFGFISGPTEDIPVKVTGNVKNGFNAEFLPVEVGIHMILVEYNGVAVGGTPFYCKVYDSESVAVSEIPRSSLGKTVTFAGLSQGGVCKWRHANIPLQVCHKRVLLNDVPLQVC